MKASISKSLTSILCSQAKMKRKRIYIQMSFRMFFFFYVPLHCVSGGVECDMLAALAPPVHLSGERLGWTMLICMVSDFRRGRLEVSWKSALQGHGPSFPTSLALNSKHRGAVAIITVATGDWPSYSCSVHHRRHQKHRRKWHTGPSGRSAADHNGQ